MTSLIKYTTCIFNWLGIKTITWKKITNLRIEVWFFLKNWISLSIKCLFLPTYKTGRKRVVKDKCASNYHHQAVSNRHLCGNIFLKQTANMAEICSSATTPHCMQRGRLATSTPPFQRDLSPFIKKSLTNYETHFKRCISLVTLALEGQKLFMISLQTRTFTLNFPKVHFSARHIMCNWPHSFNDIADICNLVMTSKSDYHARHVEFALRSL